MLGLCFAVLVDCVADRVAVCRVVEGKLLLLRRRRHLQRGGFDPAVPDEGDVVHFDKVDARADADAAKAACDAKLEEAELKAGEIIAEAKRDAEMLHADMVAEAQKEAQAIIAKAHDVIDAERDKAMAELSTSVVDLSVEIAGKVIGESLDTEQHRALAIKYLAEVGSLNDD